MRKAACRCPTLPPAAEGCALSFLPVGLLSPAVAVGGILHIGWLPKAYFAVITALALFAVVYANTGGRFRKK